ncbi:MAG: glycosyltransferase family 4 protein, partial [Nitrospirota bacterium]|nr:glycosyltransferase family 4 protein [Nitrospirota bacterium]
MEISKAIIAYGSIRKISILNFDISDNALGRAYLISKALSNDFNLAIIGSAIKGSIWESLRNCDIAVKTTDCAKFPLLILKLPAILKAIAGEGIRRNSLENTIKETGVAEYVYLLGHREDIVNVFHSIDILVHPSYANEGVPQTVLQAMAMKKPVIASDLAPLREIITADRTGVLVPLKDPESIAKEIIRLLQDKALSGQLGENGKRL